MDGSLPGLGKGMVMEFFQICGMLLFWMLEFIRLVKVKMAMGPRCLRCRLEIPSAPSAEEFFDCLMANSTCVVVK